jgi:hypothetical protein
MDDKSVLSRIGELADEELALEESHVGRPMSAEDERRLRTIEVELDQCWDLLRQRRARRAAGQDPDQAEVRPADVVERYLQ